MDRETITQLAFDTFGDRQSHPDRERGYVFYHGRRVGRLALRLRRRLLPGDGAADDVLYVAGLFHDCQKGNEPHNETGAALVREALRGRVPAADLEAIAEMVWMHNRRGQSDDPITMILQDADVLDHEGGPGLWTLYAATALAGGSAPQALEMWQATQADAAERQAGLNYDLSRQIFKERQQYYNAALRRLAREANGEIIL